MKKLLLSDKKNEIYHIKTMKLPVEFLGQSATCSKFGQKIQHKKILSDNVVRQDFGQSECCINLVPTNLITVQTTLDVFTGPVFTKL